MGARLSIISEYDDSGSKKARSDIGALDKNLSGFSSSIGKSFLGVGAAIGGAFAVGSVISTVTDYLRDAATAAIEDEKSMVGLAKAMDNVGQGFANASAEDFIKKLMLATGVADDQLRPAMQRLVTATGDAAKSQSLLQTALDVSTATGKDLTTVSTALGKAYNGNIGALTRLGVPMDAAIVKSKNFGAAVDVLNQKFGGQAAAAAETYGGQLKRVQTAAAEAQETIGYALLDAVQNASEAFGGAGGMVDVITMAGEKAADLVAGIGQAVVVLGNLKDVAESIQVPLGDTNISLADIGKNAVMAMPGVGSLYNGLGKLAESGHEYRVSQDRINASVSASEQLYAGYAAATDKTAIAEGELTLETNAAKEATDKLTAAVKAVTSALSASQSMDDFKKSLADLDTTLKGNARTFKGMGDAAKENRDTLRTALGDAASIAQKWVEDGKISADQYDAAYKGLAKKVVNQFVRDGFKRSDIESWLGSQGLWDGSIKGRLSAAEANAIGTATQAGKAIGGFLSAGIADGIRIGTANVTSQAVLTVRAAEHAAKTAAQIQSPSKVWAEMGSNLIDGLIVGMDSKKQAVADKARETMQGISDKAGEMVDKWDGHLGRLKDKLDQATALFDDFKKQASASIMDAFDFKAIAPQVDENGQMVGGTFMDGLRSQAALAMKFAEQVKTLLAQGLSREALSMVLQAGADAGSNIATDLINGGATAIAETNELVAAAQGAADEVGTLAATSFYGAGVDSAQSTYEGFKANFGPGGPARVALENLMDRLANSLSRTATITVQTVYAAAGIKGARAAGGPVTAGDAFLVGERGPELFIPSTSGSVISNDRLQSASGSGGNSYTINVNTGVGDPRQIGQEVVQYIKRFEAANGPVFAAA